MSNDELLKSLKEYIENVQTRDEHNDLVVHVGWLYQWIDEHTSTPSPQPRKGESE